MSNKSSQNTSMMILEQLEKHTPAFSVQLLLSATACCRIWRGEESPLQVIHLVDAMQAFFSIFCSYFHGPIKCSSFTYGLALATACEDMDALMASWCSRSINLSSDSVPPA
jgi:hypothetical protein